MGSEDTVVGAAKGIKAGRGLECCVLTRRSFWAGWVVLGLSGLAGAQAPGGVGLGASKGAGQSPSATQQVPQAATAVTPGAGQQAGAKTTSPEPPPVAALSQSLANFTGQMVTAIRYDGVDFDKTDTLTKELTQKAGEPLDPEKVRQSTRRLFETGRYRNIAVRVLTTDGGVTLVYAGTPRNYIGRVQVNGVKEERLASLIEYGTQLNPGTAYSPAQIPVAAELVRQMLAQNGYYQPVIHVQTDLDRAGNQVNVTYTVAIGPQARVGDVVLEGKTPGLTVAVLRKKGKLKKGAKVSRETANNALSNLRAVYQKKDRLEATLTLQKSTYDAATNSLNYDFAADEGPVVKVVVDGAKISKSRLHLLVPVYEEGTVDNDLLNEGRFKMQDYLQQAGYFDAKVKVGVEGEDTQNETVRFTVDKGAKHKVISVDVAGNQYFGSDLLKQRLQTKAGDAYQRSGRYSAEVVKADASNLEALYRANGFSAAKVTAATKDIDQLNGRELKVAQISVTFKIDEGTQQKFGSVDLGGVDASRQATLKGLLGTTDGQPFSLLTLSGDRDTLLSYYLSNGFDQAKVEVKQTVEDDDKSQTDIAFNVTEGKQVFIGKVLESGVHNTKQKLVDGQVTVHAGDPLDQSALLETQRNLYNLALFNEVVAAVQNPAGEAEQKNVIIQIVEAKRWDVTYGAGFEAQTGTPSRGQYSTTQGTTAAQQGKAGVSPRVSVDVSRINLFGTDQSLTLHTAYGLLETIATLSYQIPHFRGSKKLALQVSGGYSNVQDITTFQASTLQGDVRLTQKASRKDTFIYDFIYRRVSVNPASLEISPNLVPILSQPVLVAGPQVTWYHDTRTPSPLDATKGSYTSVVNFYASSKLGSGTDFNRTDITNSSYYQFGKKNKYVFARETRFGVIANLGINPNANPATTAAPGGPCYGTLLASNPSCNAIPLPERLYAGGATSHRGFGINDAGPRDLTTGYPVGGAGVFVNTLELRLPPPTLPYVGSSVSFVLFHDMGNVFNHVSDVFPSIKNFKQPNVDSCAKTSLAFGICNFNYFSHAVGVGARYATPVGPLRVDFSYNLNPTKYPVLPNSGVINAPYEGNTGHFNFFFSIGQSF